MGNVQTFETKQDDRAQAGPPPPASAGMAFEVGPADDRYEREAEATAQRVLAALNAGGHGGDGELSHDTGIQRDAAVVGASGGLVDGDTATLIERVRGGGSPLPTGTRRAMEGAFGGANFSNVRLHTGPVSAKLNDRLSARAFTVGNDIFLGGQMPPMNSAEGQRILAHELAHTQQQARGVHRLWKPTTTNQVTTLRSDPAGRAADALAPINKDAEIVADRARTVTDASHEGWTLAADVRPTDWTPAKAPADTYIKDSALGADKAYPQDDRTVKVDGRYHTATRGRRWSDQIGEYVYLEDSPRGGGAEIVKKPGHATFEALLPSGALVPLNADEQLFTDVAALKAHVNARLSAHLTAAETTNHIPAGLLNTSKNVDKLLHPLRLDTALSQDPLPFARWYAWKEAVLAKIGTAAGEAAASVEHWRSQLHPTKANQVAVTKIALTGSDLHDRGLGALMVSFTKPKGPKGSKFPDKNIDVVIKPEDRDIEKAMFGTEAGSLANRVNRLAGLGRSSKLATFKMETHATHGSIIEFVKGTAAEDLKKQKPKMSAAGREAMVLAYIAGLSDVHKENVIYVGSRPYFIDADNALNAARVELNAKPVAEHQSGFTRYSATGAVDEMDDIKSHPDQSDSKIMKALLKAGKPVPIIDAVRKTFTGKSGRVVPLATATWGAALKSGTMKNNLSTPIPYFGKDVGANTDASALNGSRWAIVNQLCDWLPQGTPTGPEPGLEGESGQAAAGRVFSHANAGAEVKRDLDEGKVPFFTYDYDSGHVTINNQVIWHGRPLAETLEVLLTRFPHQRNQFDIP